MEAEASSGVAMEGVSSVGQTTDETGGVTTDFGARAPKASASGSEAMDDHEELGIRAEKLKQALDHASLKFCSKARRVLKFFPTVKGHRAQSIKTWATMLASQLRKCIDDACLDILKELNVIHFLNQLDRLAADPSLRTSDGSPAWRPSGDPDVDVDSADATGQTVHDALADELTRVSRETSELERELVARDARLEQKKEKIRRSWSAVEKLQSITMELPVDDISRVLQEGKRDKSALTSPRRKRKRRY